MFVKFLKQVCYFELNSKVIVITFLKWLLLCQSNNLKKDGSCGSFDWKFRCLGLQKVLYSPSSVQFLS